MNDGHVLYDTGVGSRSAGETIALEPTEVRHARTLRLAPDQGVRVSDGCGTLWSAVVTAVGKRTTLRLERRVSVPSPLAADLWAAVGNKQAMLWLVEKATEFAAASITPVECERSSSVADAARTGPFWDKAERRAIAALKQSGGAWLPRLESPVGLDDILARAAERTGACILLDPGGLPLRDILDRRIDEGGVGLLVGPEGGLSGDERARCLDAGFVAATLGPSVLRFETAAIAALAIVAQASISRHPSTIHDREQEQ